MINPVPSTRHAFISCVSVTQSSYCALWSLLDPLYVTGSSSCADCTELRDYTI